MPKEGSTVVDKLNRSGNDTVDRRAKVEADAKYAIARYLLCLIFGFVSKLKSKDEGYYLNDRGLGIDITKLKTQAEIIEDFEQTDLTRKLQGWWLESNRTLCIDAGTTNLITVQHINAIHYPNENTTLTCLTVCTNSGSIYREMGNVDKLPRVIMFGGHHRENSQAMSGTMTMNFLRANSNLQFGMSIIGAHQVISAGKGVLKIDAATTTSFEEAQLKAEIFRRSTIRIIAIDHTKIKDEVIPQDDNFITIHSDHLDLLVVSKLPENIASNAVQRDTYESVIQHFRNSGVNVILV
jgi:DeoR/GlpR family transcriptional regulator of sugar metabolism